MVDNGSLVYTFKATNAKQIGEFAELVIRCGLANYTLYCEVEHNDTNCSAVVRVYADDCELCEAVSRILFNAVGNHTFIGQPDLISDFDLPEIS